MASSFPRIETLLLDSEPGNRTDPDRNEFASSVPSPRLRPQAARRR
jgi:hypothetical protein